MSYVDADVLDDNAEFEVDDHDDDDDWSWGWHGGKSAKPKSLTKLFQRNKNSCFWEGGGPPATEMPLGMVTASIWTSAQVWLCPLPK